MNFINRSEVGEQILLTGGRKNNEYRQMVAEKTVNFVKQMQR